jgi:Dual specificity phosphatase, catalytic domain
MMAWNTRNLAEVQPGLFLGGIGALYELPKIDAQALSVDRVTSGAIHWTVISVLDSEKLIRLTRHMLSLERRGEPGSQQSASTFIGIAEATAAAAAVPAQPESQTSASATPTQTACTIHRHFIWHLPDRMGSSLLSTAKVSTFDRDAGSSHVQVCEERSSEIPLQEALVWISDSVYATSGPPTACLIHCAQGISRSAAVCVAWMLQDTRWRQECSTSATDSLVSSILDRLRQVRPCVQPNLSFLADLRALEQCNGDVQAVLQRRQKQSAEANLKYN